MNAIEKLMALADAYAGPEHDSLSNARAALETALQELFGELFGEPVAEIRKSCIWDDMLVPCMFDDAVVGEGDILYTRRDATETP